MVESNIRKFFTKDECEFIINFTKKLKQNDSKKYFSNNDGIEYFVWSMDRNIETQWIFDRMFTYFEEETDIKIKTPINTLFIHQYLVGNRFKRHVDKTDNNQLHNIGVCLNDDYEGGWFKLYEPDLILPKKQGEIYTFKSARPHEVMEILSGERWSIISFLHLDNLEFKKHSLI
jgi:hypothetical protein